jgi:hypothetical protein
MLRISYVPKAGRGRHSRPHPALALGNASSSYQPLVRPANRVVVMRIALAIKAKEQNSAPSSPMSGTLLAVFGSAAGAASAAGSAAGAGVGAAMTIRIGTSCFGGAGGGGALPVLLTCSATTVDGTSTTR